MFLYNLTKKEKYAFSCLANYVANVDGNFTIFQKKLIESYHKEMEIEDKIYNPEKFNLDEILSKIKLSKSQRIILLETLVLVYSDEIFHDAEKSVILKMKQKFNINPNLYNLYKEWAKSILAIYRQGKILINLNIEN